MSRTERFRVVYLDHVAQLSGGELALFRLLTMPGDVDAHVILAESGPLVDRLQSAGISVEVLPLPRRTAQLRKSRIRSASLPSTAIWDTFVYTLRLAGRLRVLHPDVVHTNSLKSGVYGSLAGRLAGLPVVWHLRDRIDTDYLPRLAVLLVRALVRWLPHVVVANSRTTLDTIRRERNSMVIGSVVSSNPRFERGRAGRSSGGAGENGARPLGVGIVGRLAPWKGQDVFLRAFARAFQGKTHRAVVIGAPLFGEEEAAYAAGLRHLAEELGVADRVEFRGHVEDLACEFEAIDILVHASTIPEPFGQVVVEGMSAALSVVATRGGGPAEIITDGVDGLLYPAGDVTALAEILLRLEAAPDLRERLGRVAARRARDFSPAAISEQIMFAYEVAGKVALDSRRWRFR